MSHHTPNNSRFLVFSNRKKHFIKETNSAKGKKRKKKLSSSRHKDMAKKNGVSRVAVEEKPKKLQFEIHMAK